MVAPDVSSVTPSGQEPPALSEALGRRPSEREARAVAESLASDASRTGVVDLRETNVARLRSCDDPPDSGGSQRCSTPYTLVLVGLGTSTGIGGWSPA